MICAKCGTRLQVLGSWSKVLRRFRVWLNCRECGVKEELWDTLHK